MSSCDGLPGIPGIGPSAETCTRCKAECEPKKAISQAAYDTCFLSCILAGGGAGGAGTPTTSQTDDDVKCKAAATAAVVAKYGHSPASAEEQQAYWDSYRACMKAKGWTGTDDSPKPPTAYETSACSVCSISNVPACLVCLADTLSKALVTIGVNVLLGALVLVGLYFLFHDQAEGVKKVAKKAALLIPK